MHVYVCMCVYVCVMYYVCIMYFMCELLGPQYEQAKIMTYGRITLRVAVFYGCFKLCFLTKKIGTKQATRAQQARTYKHMVTISTTNIISVIISVIVVSWH